jgi:hypothetical protein
MRDVEGAHAEAELRSHGSVRRAEERAVGGNLMSDLVVLGRRLMAARVHRHDHRCA